jgi:hypothetical protein
LLPKVAGGWLTVPVTAFCYGLPLTASVSLACGFARAANGHLPLSWRQLWAPAVLGVLLRSSLFLFALLIQGFLAVFLVRAWVDPSARMTAIAGGSFADPAFGAADTLLATQLSMLGVLILILQFLLAVFVVPLHLFRELPPAAGWRLSFLAVQLNSWLIPVLGLSGLALILLSWFPAFSLMAQIVALPLPAYSGALLYVAWMEVFQGGVEEEALARRETPA